jgi:alkanesulfonate monooxygenase
MSAGFHWMLPKAGEVAMKTIQETYRGLTTRSQSPAALPDMDRGVRFARAAEESGIKSVLMSFSRYEPDTLIVACALGRATSALKFIVVYRSGLMQPTTFVQQVNTLGPDRRARVGTAIGAGGSESVSGGLGQLSKRHYSWSCRREIVPLVRQAEAGCTD